MCGICGIYLKENTQSVDRDLLKRMNETMIHRGPDSDGFYFDGNFAMAMRRLSIIDVSGGNQPITNEDNSIAVVFNGEIYNFQELRSELEPFGHQFTTRSDTEVIVHAYEQWGDDCLLKFNGMFTIALWDANQQRLLIARDRMGKKPLHWHHSDHGLIWGSEAKSLLVVPWVEKYVNPLALHHYLTLQYTPDPLTMFDGIFQLPAAHKLVVEQGSEPRISRWWQLEFQPKWQITDGEAIEHSRSLLSSAVTRRLISEVPLGAFLSGGIDSSIIVALMAKNSSLPIKTFSIAFDEPRYSETNYARQIVEMYGTDHHEFIFRASNLMNILDGVIGALDEPLADQATLPLYELARQTRQHVTVALSGDGGDETLAGYQRYILDDLLSPYAALPAWVTQQLVPKFVDVLPEVSWIPEDRNIILGVRRLAQFSAVTHKASLIRWGSYFSQHDKLDLYTDYWREEFSRVDTSDLVATVYDEALASSQLDRTLYTDHETYLVGALLPKTDRMTMAHSLEARSPFLDVDWMNWTARLPERYKVRRLQSKWLLRAAFPDLLPPAIQSRGKQGFGVPVGLWLRHELKPWAKERLLDSKQLKTWFRPEGLEKLLTAHDNGTINHGKRIWSLLVFAIWLEKYSVDSR